MGLNGQSLIVADFGLKDMAFQLEDSYKINADILRRSG